MPLGRGSHESYSEKYADGETPHAAFNKNVEWLRYSYVWWIYAALVVSATTVLRMLLEGSKYRDLGTVLTVTHTINNLIFFYAFHWAKGSPDHLAQGEFNGQTLWEQIDGGIPWTKTKKIFFLIHTLLVFAASYASDYQLDYLLINIPVWLLLGIIPKIPEMHGVRVFGINSTIGIDEKKVD